MNYFNTIQNTITKLICVFALLVFSHGFVSAQEVLSSPGVISAVSDFSVYPYFYETSYQEGVEGFCILGSFETQEDTQIKVRFAPYTPEMTFTDLEWVYSSPNSIASITPSLSSVNMTVLNNVEPATTYFIEVFEVFSDGTFHTVTPSNNTDSFAFSCSPTQTGGMPDVSCGQAVEVLTVCAPPVASDQDSFLSIQNISTDASEVSFDLVPQNIEPQVVQVLYTQDISIVLDGSYAGANVYTTEIGPNNQNIPVVLNGLVSGVTYYITVVNVDDQVLLNPQYETVSVGSVSDQQNDTNNNNTNNNPMNINIDVNVSNPPELAGEDIQQGLVQCGFGQSYDCDFNALLETIDRVLKFLLYIIVLPLAAILFAVAGIKLIIAREKGKEAAMSDAKSLFGNVVIGLALALGAWIIIKFVLVIFGYTDASGVLTQILGITTTQ